MYSYGHGVKESNSKALEFFKKGVRQGDYYCYAAMVEHLFQYEEQPDNYLKAMKLFFKTRNESINKVVEKRAEEEGDSVEGVMIGFIRYILTYFDKDRKVPVTVPSEILEKMSPYKTQFIERIMKLMEYSKNGNHDSSGWLKYIEWAEFNL